MPSLRTVGASSPPLRESAPENWATKHNSIGKRFAEHDPGQRVRADVAGGATTNAISGAEMFTRFGSAALYTIAEAEPGDPTIVDLKFNSTARGWAEYGGQQEVVDLLDA